MGVVLIPFEGRLFRDDSFDVVPESHACDISLMTRPAFLLSRRRFLRRAGLLSGAVVTAPLILRQALLGADAPGRKIVLGMIGMGRQMLALNLRPFLESPDCVVAAVCDVDAWRLEQGQKAGQDFYARRKVGRKYSGCRPIRISVR